LDFASADDYGVGVCLLGMVILQIVSEIIHERMKELFQGELEKHVYCHN
jgi:hypothetical protein